jgi:hypothetical protein
MSALCPSGGGYTDGHKDGYVKVGLYQGVQTDPSIVPIEIVVEDTGLVCLPLVSHFSTDGFSLGHVRDICSGEALSPFLPGKALCSRHRSWFGNWYVTFGSLIADAHPL